MSDDYSLPTTSEVKSPYDVPQNNNILPRNIFTGGTIPGNTVMIIGNKQIIIDGKNSQITVGVPAGQHFVLDGQTNRITFYDQTGASVGYIIGDYLQGEGIIISKGTFNDSMISNADMTVRGPLNVGILGTDGVINLLSTDGAAKVKATNGNLTLDAGAGAIIDHLKDCYVTGLIYASGDITAGGNIYGANKYFLIPHPTKKKNNLQYACPESPEVLNIYRGKSKTKEEILSKKPEELLPDHFIAISEMDTLDIQIGESYYGGFSWIATAIRKGYKDFDCEPISSSPESQQNQPPSSKVGSR
jgi:hypothetical protein